jgi:hypothetical protein
MTELNFQRLAESKKRLERGDANLMLTYAALLKAAEKLLQHEPGSVMQKTAVPPSGDKHDYMSLAPYWWPNPATTHGLPYIRKDGETNPEVKD